MDQPAASQPLYLNEHDAADALAVRPSTLKRWRREKKGPAHTRIGRKVVYRPEAIREYLERGERQ